MTKARPFLKMELDDAARLQPVTYQTLTKLSAIVNIAPEWDALLSQSICNRAFSAPEWFIATCRFHPTMRPQVITAWRGPTLVGILPLVLLDDGEVAAFPNYLCDYSDIIVAKDDLATLTSLVRHAGSPAQSYRRLRLTRVRPDSNCVEAMRALALTSTADWRYDESRICPYIALPASHDEYLATRGGEFRKSLRRARRQAERDHLILEELMPSHFPASQVTETFLSLLLSRHTGRSSFTSSVTQAVFSEILPALYCKRSLRVFAAFAEGRMIAIDLCMVGADSLCAWNGGFLPEAAHWSPGKLLTDYGIQQAFAMNLAEYDFLRGEEAYKASWATSSRDIGRLEFDVIGKE